MRIRTVSVLLEFDGYLCDIGLYEKKLNEPIVENWIQGLSGKSHTVAGKVSQLRLFCKHLHTGGIDAYIPPAYKARDEYVPYLFSDEEYEQIFCTADNINFSVNQANPWIQIEFPVILRLLYSCGLRHGETAIEDYLMEKYKGLVRQKARAMFLIGGDTDDLIQEGMIGLIKAVRDFDETQKTSFSSFAELCVSRQMYSAIEASNRKKHLPLNSYVSLYEDSEQEGEGRSLPLIDTIESSKENDPEVLYFGKEYTEAFAEQLKELLSPLENHVLYLHLMGTDYRTIAELLGKSPKSVDNALQRIKTKAQKILP